MNTNRVANAKKNTKSGILHKTINLVFPFIVRSVIIHVLGAEYYGVNGLFVSVLSVLNLTELGVSNAFAFSMYKPAAENDYDKLCALINLYKKIYRIIGLVVFTFGLVVLPFIRFFIDGDVPDDVNIYIIFLLFLIDSVLDYILFGYKASILSVYQKEYVINKNLILYNIILYLSQIACVILARSFYLYAMLIPICRVLLNVLNNHSSNNLFPEIQPKGKVSDHDIAELKKNVYGLAIWKIGGASRNSFDSIFISKFLGLVTITIYSNYFCVINGVDMMVSVVCSSITAVVANKIVLESSESNYSDFIRFQFLYMWIIGWCVVCIYCLIQPFMFVWMGEDLVFSDEIVVIICYYFFMLKKGDINSVYYNASGLWWNGRYRSLIETFLNILMNYFLGKKYGVIGILLASIISFSLVNVYGSYIIFRDYFKNKKYFIFCFENFVSLVFIIIACILTKSAMNWIACLFDIQNNWIILIIGLWLCIFIPNIIFILAYGFRKPYNSYLSYAKSIVFDRIG